MNCTECGSPIDTEQSVTLKVGCAPCAIATAHPCTECGRLHFGDGESVLSRSRAKVYLRDGAIVRVPQEQQQES